MPEPALAETARRLAPRVSLASCVRAYLTRDTRHIPLLPPAQRLTRFPASVHCSLSWFIEGSAQMLDPASGAPSEPLARAVFGGPHTQPTLCINPGPVQAFIVLFFPQALHALAGLDISQQVDRVAPLHEVLGEDWQALTPRMLAARDDAERIALLEDFLEPRWREARRRGAVPGGPLDDWLNAAVAQAASAGWGRSARNLERRIKAWAGQPLRRLRRLSRVEQIFLDARQVAQQEQAFSWADLAARGGYADQAHFCRETRALTGHTPAELARRARDDESYWIYRVWS